MDVMPKCWIHLSNVSCEWNNSSKIKKAKVTFRTDLWSNHEDINLLTISFEYLNIEAVKIEINKVYSRSHTLTLFPFSLY